MPHFIKPPISPEEQLNLLESKGLLVMDRDAALHQLRYLSYCRLRGYLQPLQDQDTKQFFKGASFEQVVSLYEFDRDLRLHILNAVERIEVAIRTKWANHLSLRYGSHAHLNDELFSEKFYCDDLRALKKELSRSREDLIESITRKYSSPEPPHPIWVVCEAMSLGLLSRWYSNLRAIKDRRQIAAEFQFDADGLASFLKHLTELRNQCAHHARVWNRRFTRVPKFPTRSSHLPLNQDAPRNLYNTLVLLANLVELIETNFGWALNLRKLISSSQIKIEKIGGTRELWVDVFWQDRNY